MVSSSIDELLDKASRGEIKSKEDIQGEERAKRLKDSIAHYPLPIPNKNKIIKHNITNNNKALPSTNVTNIQANTTAHTHQYICTLCQHKLTLPNTTTTTFKSHRNNINTNTPQLHSNRPLYEVDNVNNEYNVPSYNNASIIQIRNKLDLYYNRYIEFQDNYNDILYYQYNDQCANVSDDNNIDNIIIYSNVMDDGFLLTKQCQRKYKTNEKRKRTLKHRSSDIASSVSMSLDAMNDDHSEAVGDNIDSIFREVKKHKSNKHKHKHKDKDKDKSKKSKYDKTSDIS